MAYISGILALASAGLGIGGAAMSGSASSKSARHAREFADKMSRTQIQRAVKDMTKAGINPILAVSGGVHGSTPSPVQPSTPDYMKIGNMIDGGSVKGIMKLGEQLKQQKIETENLSKFGSKMEAETEDAWNRARASDEQAFLFQKQQTLVDQQKNESVAREGELNSQAMKHRMDTAIEGTRLPGAIQGQRFDESNVGKALQAVDRVVRSLIGRDQSGARR